MKRFNTDPKKGENKFKFLTISDRLSQVNVDIFRSKSKISDVPLTENETYFQRELTNWADRNGTEEFAELRDFLKPKCISLPMILFHLETIVEEMNKYLSEPSSAAAEPILGLLAILARDMRNEFYPLFPKVLKTMIHKIDAWKSEPEVLENLFETIAFIFKYLQKQMVKDIKSVFSYYAEFFDHSKDYVRKFAAETFAFLIRKLPEAEFEPQIDYMLSFVPQRNYSEDFSDGLGQLLFFIVKGIKGQFNSTMPKIFQIALRRLGASSSNGDLRNASCRLVAVLQMVKMMRKHLKATDTKQVWGYFLAELNKSTKVIETTSDTSDIVKVQQLVIVMSEWARNRHQSDFVTPASLSVTISQLQHAVSEVVLHKAFVQKDFPRAAVAHVLELITILLQITDHADGRHLPVTIEHGQYRLDETLSRCFSLPHIHELTKFVLEQTTSQKFGFQFVTPTLEYINKQLQSPSDEAVSLIIHFVYNLAEKIPYHQTVGQNIDSNGQRLVPIGENLEKTLLKILHNGVSKFNPTDADQHSLLWAALNTSVHIKFSTKNASQLEKEVAALTHAISAHTGVSFILSEAIKTQNRLIQKIQTADQLAARFETSIGWGITRTTDLWMVKETEDYLQFLVDGKLSDRVKDHLEKATELLDLLVLNLSGPSQPLRQSSLRVIRSLRALFPTIPLNAKLVDVCVFITETEISPLEARLITVEIHRIRELIQSASVTALDRNLAMRFLFGLFHVKFTILWGPARDVVTSIAHNDPKLYWKLLWPLFRLAQLEDPEEKEEDTDSMEVAIDDSSSLLDAFKVAKHIDAPATDTLAYNRQLWQCLQEMHKLVQVGSAELRPLVDLFIEFIAKRYEEYASEADVKPETEEIFRDQSAKINLIEYLKFFGGWKSMKQIHRADTLYKIFSMLLTHGNENVQRAALDCLFLWKQEFVLPYKDVLIRFITQKDLREAMSSFSVHSSKRDIMPEHRPQVAELLTKILYPRLSVRGRANSQLNSRRVAVLAFLAGFSSTELAPFFHLLLRPYEPLLNRVKAASAKAQSKSKTKSLVLSKEAADVSDIVGNRQVGFLNLLEDVMKQMLGVTDPYLDDILIVTLVLIKNSISTRNARQQAAAGDEDEDDAEEADGDNAAEEQVVDEEEPAVEKASKESLSKIRRLAWKRLGQIFQTFPSWDYSLIHKELLGIMEGEVATLHQQVRNVKAGGVLELCLVMSRHLELAVYLKPLLETILKCLMVPHLSPQVRGTLYSFIENLLALKELQEDAMDVDESSLKKEVIDFVVPHIDLLFAAMQFRLENDYSRRRKKFGPRELSLLQRLSAYAKSGANAEKLIALLMPYLKLRHVNAQGREDILMLFRNMVPSLQRPMKYLNTIARLFATVDTVTTRTALVEVIDALGNLDDDLRALAPALADLNAWSGRRIDEIDYDRRFAAYQKINEEMIDTITETQIYVVVFNYIYYMSHDDLSIRGNASYGLAKIVEQVAKGARNLKPHIVSETILPAVRRGLDTVGTIARQEFTTLLNNIIKSMPSVTEDLAVVAGSNDETNFFLNVYHLQVHRRQRAVSRLVDTIKEGSLSASSLMRVFFPILKHSILSAGTKQHNLVDESIRAIAAIAAVVDWTQYSRILATFVDIIGTLPQMENQLVKLICAVIDSFHFDVSKEFTDITETVKAHGRRVIEAPAGYFQKKNLKRNAAKAAFREKTKAAEEEAKKAAEADKKDEEEDTPEQMDLDKEVQPDDDTKTAKAAEVAEESSEEEEESDMEDQTPLKSKFNDDDQLMRHIQRQLLGKVIPDLQSVLKEKKGDFRTPVAVAIVKVLKLLPESISEFQIASLLTRIVSELSNRNQLSRDSARETLQHILLFLGSKYFPFILQMIHSNLTKGYQLHVLGYTTHYLLKGLVPKLKPGELDPALPDINRILFQDILGAPEEQREVKEIANKMKETKHSLSLDSFLLVAQSIDFKNSIGALIDPIKEVLTTTADVAVVKKLQDVLVQLVQGLKMNPSVDVKDMLLHTYFLIKQNMDPGRIDEENRKKEKKKAKDPLKKLIIEPDPRQMRKLESATVGNEHLVSVFALSLLHSFLKGGKVDIKDSEQLEMLDPFVVLFFKCMGSRFDRVLVGGLKCVCQILPMPLPSIQNKADALCKRSVVLMQKANPHSELLRMTFKTITHLLREVKSFQMADYHLNIVFNYIRIALDEMDKPNVTFALIKALVWKKVVVSAIYDLMPVLTEMLVQTTSLALRSHCETILVQFLLTYPLGGKRLQQHLDVVISNMGHSFQPGRYAILNLLYNIFQRFPEAVLNDRAEYFFLPLVAQMVNDDSIDCREKAGAALNNLIKHIDVDHRATLLNMALQWYAPKEGVQVRPELQRAASQLLGIFVPHYGGAAYDKFIQRVLPLIKSILQNSPHGDDEEEDANIDSIADTWQLVYFSLVALEKIIQLQPKLSCRKDFVDVLGLIAAKLLHPHIWVRLVCSRIFGQYFSYRTEHRPLDPEKHASDDVSGDYLMVPHNLFNLAKSFSSQLESEFLSAELGTQVVKDLLFSSIHLHKYPQLTPPRESDLDVLSGSSDEDEPVIKSPHRGKSTSQQIGAAVPDSDDEDDVANSDDEDEDEDADDAEADAIEAGDIQRRGLAPIHWIFRRLSYMARKDGNPKKTFIFQWFAAMATKLEAEEVIPFLVPMLNPLYRVQEEPAPGNPESELGVLKELVSDVIELIKNKVGSSPFFAAYERVRRSVAKVRNERKRARKLLALQNPQRRAELKMKKNLKKRDRKKRKIEKFKVNSTGIKVRKLD